MKAFRIVLVFISVLSLLIGIAVFLLTGGMQHDVSTLVALGEKYLEEGDYEEAALQFERAIAISEKSPEVWYGSARANIGLGNDEEAIKALKTVAELDPSQKDKVDWMIEKIKAGEGMGLIHLLYKDAKLEDAEPETGVEAAIDFSKTYNMYCMHNINVVDEDESYYTINADLFGYEVISAEQYNQLSEGTTWQGIYHTYTVGPEKTMQQEGSYRYRELYGDDGLTYYVSLGFTNEYEAGAQEEDSSFSTAEIAFIKQNKDDTRYYAILSGTPFWGSAANGLHPFTQSHSGVIEYSGTYRIRKGEPLFYATDWPTNSPSIIEEYWEFNPYEVEGWWVSASLNESGEVIAMMYPPATL